MGVDASSVGYEPIGGAGAIIPLSFFAEHAFAELSPRALDAVSLSAARLPIDIACFGIMSAEDALMRIVAGARESVCTFDASERLFALIVEAAPDDGVGIAGLARSPDLRKARFIRKLRFIGIRAAERRIRDEALVVFATELGLFLAAA